MCSERHEFNFHAESKPFWISFGQLSDIIYCYVTTIFLLTPPFHYKLKYAPCADQYNVHTMNPDIHLMCKMPIRVNVYRAECSLSDADSHFFRNNSSCSLLIVCITNREKVLANLGYLMKTPKIKKYLCTSLEIRCKKKRRITWIRRLNLRRLMSYIYGAPILDVSRSHTTTQHSR